MKLISQISKGYHKTNSKQLVMTILISALSWLSLNHVVAQSSNLTCEEMLLIANTKKHQQIQFVQSQIIAAPNTVSEENTTKSFAQMMGTCNILTSGLTDVHCNDNGTPNNQLDDYLAFYLKPTGSVLSGSGYNVSVEGGGTTITPTSSSSYNTLTKFRLGNGSANGSTWAIRITDKADPNCFFIITVNCPSCSVVCPAVVNQICIGENTSYLLQAPAGLTNVVWYDSTTRTQIGTGSSIVIDINTLGMSDNYEAYYFEAKNADNCEVLLCCPARFKSEICCNIQASITNSPCNDNNTRQNKSDDYFTITVSSTNVGAAGPSNAFEVVLNGTTVIGTGTYGTPLTIGNSTTPPFKPDGVSTYSITVRDKDKQTCITEAIIVGPVRPCFIPDEGVTCTDPEQFYWSQDIDPVTGNPSVVRLICGSTVSYVIPGPYPYDLGQPVKITNINVVSYDGYPDRNLTPAQPNEKWRLVFKKGGSVVGTSGYTGDIVDGVLQNSWVGDLGMVTLPLGTDEIVIEHYSIANDGACATGPNSVDPVVACLTFEPLYDWGDLDDPTNGTSTGNYQTRSADNGPSHRIINGLKIGNVIDFEADGNPSTLANGDDNSGSPDDEDGVILPMFVAGVTSVVPVTVMNMTGSAAKLTMFMDFNNDGDFSDAGEMASSNVPDGTNGIININILVPVTAVPNVNLGVRFRLSTDAGSSMSATGAAPDGEVEDYLAQVMAYDWGDLADATNGSGTGNYQTRSADNGPSHKIITGLKIGSIVDAEADGNPSALATGDDNTTSDDEDGVTLPMFTAGQTATVPVNVMNMTGSDAKLTMFMDFNNDGDFSDAGEMTSTTVVTGTNGIVNLNLAVPATATLNTNVGVRFRLSTDFAASMNPVSAAPDGEVEDYLAQVMGFDLGDLADSGAGTGTGNYETQYASNGPSHKIISGLKIGASVDAEGDGNQSILANGDDSVTSDDEDGVTLPMFIAGQTAIVPVNVMNTTGTVAKLTMFMDFNNDGDFSDPGEMTSANVPNGTNGTINLSLTVPVNAVFNTNLGIRFRLSTDAAASMSSVGAAPDGEVEDYLDVVMGYDYGDLSDSGPGSSTNNYNTLNSDNGPSHKIITGLKIGSIVDAEGDGNPSALANGDDNTMGDDEDGVNLPMFIAGQNATVPVSVMNMTGTDAKLTMFIDFNNDGDFLDAGEMTSTTIVDGTNTVVNLNIAVPATATLNTSVGVRFRLSTDFAASMSPTDAAPNGEVEDYLVQIMGYDLGDLADNGVGTGTGNYETQYASNGPSHKIISGLRIGAIEDAEGDGNQSTLANGDDNITSDDEDGMTLPMFIAGETAIVPVSILNITGSVAKLTMFMDFNNDGDFNDIGEMTSANVPDGTNGLINLSLAVPVNAVLNTDVGIRFRLSTDFAASMSSVGAAPDGEVEDYMAKVMGYDRGDLADNAIGTTSGNYQTLNNDNGPSHKIISGLKMGLSVDAEANGNPSVNADGDDFTGIGDDEDGLTLPAFFTGTTVNIPIVTMNMIGSDAKLTVFVDFNNDGDFNDAGEMSAITVANGTNTTVNVPVSIPLNAVTGTPVGVRARLSTDAVASMNPVGPAPDGEVEDYLVTITGPNITHTKTISNLVQTNANQWAVTYQIDVNNSTLGSGTYGLEDITGFDNDVTILSSSFTSNAPGNPGNPGPVGLIGAGPWALAANQLILGSTTHTYYITVNVKIDLSPGSGGDNIYKDCGFTIPGVPSTGEGLFNRTELDVWDDGTINERDTACTDIPYIVHDKKFLDVTQVNQNTWNVRYQIDVKNQGGASGQYDLRDEPAYDNDITINNASYTSNAPGNPGIGLPITPPWTLANDQNIAAGGLHSYILTVNVTLDLEDGAKGDDIYKECGDNGSGQPNEKEGLFNRSLLDVNNDGVWDQRDSVCADLPYIIHQKTLGSIVSTGPNAYDVSYNIKVTNIGGARGYYTLKDQPSFDDDITILGGNVQGGLICCGAFINPFVGNPGELTLVTNSYLDPGLMDVFSVTFHVVLDLSTGSNGNNTYTKCGTGTPGAPISGEGLFNESQLDIDNDGITDRRDSVCADLPYIVHEKTISNITMTGANTYTVDYQIKVENIGGASGSYNLTDQPGFDDDITINSTSYTSNAIGNSGNPGPLALVGSGPWTLANNQNIGVGVVQLYNISVKVKIDLSPASGGDNIYASCGNGGLTSPQNGEGLFNQSLLDVNRDGITDYRDSVCADLPYIVHEKRIVSVTDLGNGNYSVKYGIKVNNIGGATGQYDLYDAPGFDDDFAVLNAQYSSTAPGHPANPGPVALAGIGPWNIANDQNIPAGASHDYIITVNVNIDLVDIPTAGDEIYHHCGSTIPGIPSAGEGLFNQSLLDVNNDGFADQRDTVCTDVEIIDLALRKTVVTPGPYKYGDNITFKIEVFNQGNTPAYNLTIADYLPSGYGFSPLNVGWTMFNPSEYRSPIFAGPLAPNTSTSFNVILTLQMTNGGATNWINYAEVNDFTDPSGTSIANKDIDSKPHSDGIGERAVTPGSIADNNITSKDKGGEEDDHDPAGIEVFDLALRKTTTNPTGPWKYGDIVPFTITVFNQGNVEARDVQVVDYLPSGLDFGSGNAIWSYDVGTRMALTTIASIPAGGQVSVVINMIVRPSLTGMSEKRWYNEAEIKTSRDNNNTTRTEDIDSRFDMNPNNDNDVVCDGPDDDEINEDGKNIPGDDEDDNDIEWIHVFDLALKKTEVSSGPYRYGQDVRFRLTVYNQGNITAQTIKLTDYLPAGFALSSSNPNGWVMNGGNAEYTITTPLSGGDSTFVEIYLTVVMTEGGRKDWMNYAEITTTTDTNGDNSMKDADSMPGSDTPTERNVVEDGPADNNTTSNDKGGEEDDHDPDGINVYDLALIKKAAISGPYSYGQVVPFTIQIINQGNIGAKSIQLVDYIPNGFEWVSTNEPDWTYFNASKTATYTYPFLILPGDTGEVTIYLKIVPSLPGGYDRWVNYTEIKGSTDENNNPKNPMDDMDSMSDTNKNNDTGGVPDTADDNNVEGDKYQGEDEDDHDPARLEIIDLALRKVLDNPGAHVYYDHLDFSVWVFNQGNTSVNDVEITDYKPSGYGFNALLPQNAGWSLSGSDLKYTINTKLKPGDSIRISLRLQILQTNGGEKDWINYSEITEVFDTLGRDRTSDDIDSNPGSNNPTENGVEPGDLEDDNISSNDKGGEEDDHDPAGIEIFDLAQRKYVDEAGPFQYGDEVSFRITVFNQGSIEAKDIEIVDYIPDGFTFSANNVGWTSIGSNMVKRTITGPLKPGDSTFIQINLDLRYSENKFAWDNYSEIKSAKDYTGANRTDDFDSNEDMINGNDLGGQPNTPTDNHVADDGKDGNNDGITDEDDHDVARVPVWDLALIKKVNTAGPYHYGQTIRFDVIAYNQGNYVMDQVTLVDYLSQGYGFTPGGLNTGWTQVGTMLTYVHNGNMVKGDSVIVPLYLKILQTNGGRTHWTNRAEIKTATDTTGVTNVLDADGSTPNMNPDDDKQPGCGEADDDNKYGNAKNGEDEDDHDPACIEVFDLALRKKYSGPYPIKYNDIVPFTITLFNQGNVSGSNIAIVDYIPVGYDWVANAGWTYNAGTRMATTNYVGTILPGNSADITVNLKVVPSYASISDWDNLAEIKSATAEDGSSRSKDFDSDFDMNPSDDMGGIVGTPTDDHVDDDGKDTDGNGIKDHDDHDPSRPQILNLALRKWVPGKKLYYLPGDTVSFRIRLFNQGNVFVQNVTINDYMPQGYAFSTALGYNTGWVNNAGTLNYTYTGRINPMDSVFVTLNLIVKIAAVPTQFDWDNYAEIKSVQDTFNTIRDNDDADSKPNTDSPWERQVNNGHPWDNIIDGQGQPENEDEDDHDFERVTVTGFIGDKVWKDNDGDGLQDPQEPGIPNVIVHLYNCDGKFVKKDTTDVNGNYGFEALLSGNYFVQFFNPDSDKCGFTFKDSTSNDKIDSDVNPAGITDCTFLDWGERDSTIDAGLVLWASYGDYTWHDKDADGIQEAGEDPISGITVILYDAKTNLPIRSAITDANGRYKFEKLLPGNYYAKFDAHLMWNLTDPNVGSDLRDSDVDGSNGPRTTATTFLSPGEDDLTWDAGYWKCAMIGGRVFFDTDLDGIFDPTENGINGLDVYLINAMTGAQVAKLRTVVNPATPSDDGYYKFACVKPGMYYVRFERPGHLAASDPLRGADRNRDSDIGHENGVNTSRKLTILSEDMVLNLGAGFQDKAVVGDLVWLDVNANGLQDSGEQPVENVHVYAVRPNGTIVSEGMTKSDGTYTLDGIAQGDYYVRFEPPASYGFTNANQGVDLINSDVDGVNGYGTTRTYRINAGDIRPNIDAGLVFQVLPLEWLSFEGRYNGNFTELDWKTGNEINNDHFEVERRHESETSFSDIANVDASTDRISKVHEYNHDDYDVARPGIYYYRIKQVDKNGIYTYSKMISIRVNQAKEMTLSIYPNPTDESLTVDLGMTEDSELEVRVFDEAGKNVFTNPFGGYRKAGFYRESINTSILAVGHYNLQIKTSTGIINKKFTVTR